MYQFIGEFCEYTYVGIFKQEKFSDFHFLMLYYYYKIQSLLPLVLYKLNSKSFLVRANKDSPHAIEIPNHRKWRKV